MAAHLHIFQMLPISLEISDPFQNFWQTPLPHEDKLVAFHNLQDGSWFSHILHGILHPRHSNFGQCLERQTARDEASCYLRFVGVTLIITPIIGYLLVEFGDV